MMITILGYVAATIFAVGILVTNCTPGGQTEGVKLTFGAPNSKPTLHEPIYLDLQIQNGLAETIRFDLGHNRKSNLEFTITQPDGTLVQLPRMSEEGLGRVGALKLQAGKSHTERFLLNEWYPFSQPGIYKIKSTLISPITTESGRAVNVDRSATLEIEVLNLDRELLSKVLQKLAETASDQSDVVESTNASLALSYVLDPKAVPYLKQVLEKGSLAARLNAASGLGRVGNSEAVDALIATLKSSDPDLSSFVRSVLQRTEMSVSHPELRSKIKNALANPK